MQTDHSGNHTSMRSSSADAGERFERVVQVSEPVRATAWSIVPWVLGGLLALLALGFFVATVLGRVEALNRVNELTEQNGTISTQLRAAEDSLTRHQSDLATKTKQIEELDAKLKLERQARAIDSKELAEARKQKAEIEANIAARDKAIRDRDQVIGERDAARKVSDEVMASKRELEETVSILQKRLDDALARITDLESQIRKALAERDEMEDMLRVCQAKQSQANPAPQAAMLAEAAQTGRLTPGTTASAGEPIPAAVAQRASAINSTTPAGTAAAEGLSAPMSINTPPIGPGAATNVLLLPGDDSDANQNIVRQVNELTISREEARKRTEVLEDEVSRLRAEMLKARSSKPTATAIRLAASERLRPTSIGNNYTQKEVGIIGFVPDAIGNIVVGIGEGLDSLFNGTHYVPRELIQGSDAHGS